MKLHLFPLVIATVSAGFGQTLESRIEQYVEARASKNADRIKLAFGRLVDESALLRDAMARTELDAEGAAADSARKLRLRKVTRQTGESAAGGGTTSLVAKSGVADMISAAFEAGGLTRNTEGTVTTIRFNALAFSCAAFKPVVGEECPAANPFYDSSRQHRLRGLSGSGSFDNKSSSTETTAETKANFSPAPIIKQITGGGRLSSASVRYEFMSSAIQPRELESFKKAVEALKAKRMTVLEQTEEVMNNPKWNQAVEAFVKELEPALSAELPSDRQRAVSRVATLYENGLKKNIVGSFTAANFSILGALRESSADLTGKLTTAYKSALLKPTATLEYVHEAPTGQPAFSTVRFIIDRKLFQEKEVGDYEAALTANVAVSAYEKIPDGLTTGRWRSFQASTEFERKLGAKEWKSRPTLSLAAYGQYQANNTILTFDRTAVAPGTPIPLTGPAAEVLNTKGFIGIVQGKVTFKISDSISIPAAISWSNRTELVKADTWRGQVGMSLDLGNLFQKQ